MERIRLLIVEDDDAVFDTIRRRFALSNRYEVDLRRAIQVDDALDQVHRFQPHVVVLDNFLESEKPEQLDQGSGWETLLPALADHKAGSPQQSPVTICFTGQRRENTEIMSAHAWGALDFIDKSDPRALDKLEYAVYRGYAEWKSLIDDISG